MEFTLGPGHLSLKSSFKIFFSDFFLKFAIFFNLEYHHFNFTIFWHFTFSFLKSPPKNLKNNSKMLPYSILNSWRSICNIVYKEIGGWKCPQTMIIVCEGLLVVLEYIMSFFKACGYRRLLFWCPIMHVCIVCICNFSIKGISKWFIDRLVNTTGEESAKSGTLRDT